MTAAEAILELRPETERGESTAAPGRTEADRLGALTSRLGDGDEAAWTAFHQAYAPRLFRYLLVVTGGREELTSEALQQTWIRCVRHIRRFESEEALWSWLTVLARSSVNDEHRRQSRFFGFLQRLFESGPAVSADAEVPDPDRDLQELLESGLDRLDPGERALIEAKYVERRPTREIAAGMGTSEKAVESRLARLRARLREDVMRQLRRSAKGNDKGRVNA